MIFLAFLREQLCKGIKMAISGSVTARILIPTLSCLRTQDVQEKDGTVDWTHDETLRSPAGSPLLGKWDVLESFGCDRLLRVVSQIVGESRSTTIGFKG